MATCSECELKLWIYNLGVLVNVRKSAANGGQDPPDLDVTSGDVQIEPL
jgi:hypothetical protein